MRAVRVVGDGLAVAEVPDPVEDLVGKVRSVSICGTDLHFLEMGIVSWTLGHELSVAVDGVDYAVEPAYFCGACRECLSGNDNRCVGAHGTLGMFEDGGLADYVGIKQRRQLTALPAGLDVVDAACVETAAVSWRGVRLARVVPGERMCVVGGGSIGLMAVACARHHGYEVDLEAPHRHQVTAGERLGAGRPSGEYEVVIDAAGSESGLARCLELVRPGGRVVLLGVYMGLLPIAGAPLLIKEVTLIPSITYGVDEDGSREYANAAAMLAAHPDIARTVVTHRFALADAAEAFRVAADRQAGAIKVIIHP